MRCALGELPGHALPHRNSRRPEPARRGDPRLLPEDAAGGRDDADHLRRQRRRGGEISSEAKPAEYLPANAPSYWFAREDTLPKAAGVNRFVWNLRYPPPPSLPYGYGGKLLEYTEYTLADHAIPGLTPRVQPRGPLVVPGKYTAELKVGGQTLRQPLTVELDPRVHASPADLSDQLDLAQRISRGMKASSDAYQQVANLRKALTERTDALKQSESKETKDAVASLRKEDRCHRQGDQARSGIGPREPRPLPDHLQRGERRHRPADSFSPRPTELRCSRQGPGELAAVERTRSGCLQRISCRQ